MNMAGTFGETFANARPVAQHCAELTARSAEPEDRTEHLSAWRRDLGKELVHELAQLFSGGKLSVNVAEPEMMTGQDVFEQIGPVAANSLLRCGDAATVILLSFDFATAIALTDCSFGGTGKVPEEAPSELPRSAGMLVEQFAGQIAQVIAMANGSAEHARGDVLVRSESVARLKPFDADAQVALFRVAIVLGSEVQWNILLAIRSDQLDSLLPGISSGAGNPSSRKADGGTHNGVPKGGFADMPLPLEAVLGEITLPLNRLEALAPGDEIALPIRRELPLRVGEQTLAHGTLGTIENRMALRITRIQGAAKASGTITRPIQSEGAAQ